MNAQQMFGVDGSVTEVSERLTDEYLDAVDYKRRCKMAVDIARRRETGADLERAERAYQRACDQVNALMSGGAR